MAHKLRAKYTPVTIILLVLLFIRFLGQIFAAAIVMDESSFIYILFGGVYLTAIIAVAIKQRWGAILAMTIVILDFISSIFLLSGSTLIGSLIMDVALFGLSYKELINFKRAN